MAHVCGRERQPPGAHLARNDAVHGAQDGAGGRESRAEAASGQRGVAVQVPNPNLACTGRRLAVRLGRRQAGTQGLQIAHVGPLVHAQHVRDARARRRGVPAQPGELRAAQDAPLCMRRQWEHPTVMASNTRNGA